MLRVLALVTDGFGGSGGIAQYNRDLMSALAAEETVGEIIVLPRFTTTSPDRVPPKIKQASPIAAVALYVAHAIRILFQRHPIGLVFCGHLYMAPLAAVVSKLARAPMWLQLHGIEAWNRPSRLVRWSAEQSTIVTTVSRYTRRRFIGWADYEPNSVLVLPNTFGQHFTPGEENISMKAKFGLKGKRFLLTVSRLSKQDGYKGHAKIIECLPALIAEIENLAYVIVGDGDLRTELVNLAKTHGVGKAVIFLKRVESNVLRDLYRAADIFIMPSTREGFGIVFLEALACGTPVIAGDWAGARDPLQDGRLGVLTDDDGLVKAILRMMAMISAGTDCQSEGLERSRLVTKSFGPSAFLHQVSRVVKSLGGRAGDRG